MDYRISSVIALMEKQFRQRPALREMARSVQLSPSRLRHIFKTETGLTTNQYLRSLRMREAKKILDATCFSVKEVMTKVGLKDKSHFERDFKKAYGLTPAQYKTRCVRSHLVKNNVPTNGKHIGHQIASSAIEFGLHSATGDSNLRPHQMVVGDGQTIASHLDPSSQVERRVPDMEKETIDVAELQQIDELFEELSVTELEDRLELAGRCVCRVSSE